MSETTFVVDDKRIRTFIRNVNQELLNIQSGDSKYRTGAMHFEGMGPGAVNRLEMLQKNPTKSNLDEFIELAKQDFGATAADAFSKWSEGIFSEVDEKQKPIAPKKSFETRVQDSFYDLLRIGRVPLDPKQMDQLRGVASKFSEGISDEISEGIHTQLEILVKKMDARQAKADKAKKAKEKVAKKQTSPYDPAAIKKKNTKND